MVTVCVTGVGLSSDQCAVMVMSPVTGVLKS